MWYFCFGLECEKSNDTTFHILDFLLKVAYVECISSIHFLLFGQSDEKRKRSVALFFLFLFLLTNKKFPFSVKSK